MNYKLIITSIIFITISVVNVNSCINTEITDSNSSSLFSKEMLSNKNNSSQNSIASTNSNSSNDMKNITEINSKNTDILQNLTNNDKTNQNIIILQKEINNISLNDTKKNNKIDESIINKCFQENCRIQNLDINNGRRHLLTLYSYFNKLSNPKHESKTPIDKINDRFCKLLSIVYGFLKVNKELKLNKDITDKDITKIGNLTYTVYNENGLFTKDVIIKYFNLYKEQLIPLLYPLIDYNK